MHILTGRWVYGLTLALTTAVLWGLIPISLKEVLKDMDPLTATWYRFLIAGILLFLYLAAKRRLPSFNTLGKKGITLLILSIIGLLGNYVFYMLGLRLLDPGTTQLVMQIAPMLLIISSVIIFKEQFNRLQIIAFCTLMIGFIFFFNQRLTELVTSLGHYTIGILTVVLAAVLWVIYGLAQKQLLIKWHSTGIMVVLYLSNALLLFPFTSPRLIFALSSLQFWLLIFCCFNTLIAYGAFAEALAHWEASKVSATLAVAPLVTFFGVNVCVFLWPTSFTVEPKNTLAYIGIITVVMSSALIALSSVIIKKLKNKKLSNSL